MASEEQIFKRFILVHKGTPVLPLAVMFMTDKIRFSICVEGHQMTVSAKPFSILITGFKGDFIKLSFPRKAMTLPLMNSFCLAIFVESRPQDIPVNFGKMQ